jgi:hypothetical protein
VDEEVEAKGVEEEADFEECEPALEVPEAFPVVAVLVGWDSTGSVAARKTRRSLLCCAMQAYAAQK